MILLLLQTTYYFGAPERTTITFTGKTDMATITGSTTRAGGFAVDEAPATHLVVPVASLRTGMEARDDVLRRADWLDAEAHPNLEFRAEAAEKLDGDTWRLEGSFTMRGVEKPLTIAAEVKTIPETLGAKLGPGRWVRVKTTFDLKLSDFGIKVPDASIATVSDVWTVTVNIFGSTEKPADYVEPPARAEAAAPQVTLDAPGTRYRFGLKQQMTTLRAVRETETGEEVAQATVIGGIAVIDGERGAIKLVVPGDPELRFESTSMALKDGVWAVEGTVSRGDETRPIKLDVKTRELTKQQVWDARWGRKPGLGFAGSFELDGWTVTFDLIALEE